MLEAGEQGSEDDGDLPSSSWHIPLSPTLMRACSKDGFGRRQRMGREWFWTWPCEQRTHGI